MNEKDGLQVVDETTEFTPEQWARMIEHLRKQAKEPPVQRVTLTERRAKRRERRRHGVE